MAGLLFALASASMPGTSGAQAVSWAHQNGSLQSNGSITVKSLSGGSYAGSLNPAGAVAKANQSAVTQPPTVIIQATGSSARECVPMISGSLGAAPSTPACASGYTSVLTKSGANCPTFGTYNVGGTTWSLVVTRDSGSGAQFIQFVTDAGLMNLSNNYSFYDQGASAYCSVSGFTARYAANLCCK